MFKRCFALGAVGPVSFACLKKRLIPACVSAYAFLYVGDDYAQQSLRSKNAVYLSQKVQSLFLVIKMLEHMSQIDVLSRIICERESPTQMHCYIGGRHIYVEPAFNPGCAASQMQLETP